MKKSLALAVSLAIFAAGCAVTPEPMTPEDVQERIKNDHERMFSQQEPVTAPISLWEAQARALKYNLDHRVKLMEIAVAGRILDTWNYEMLPDVVLSAGYNARDNYSGGISRSLLTGEISLEPSTSQEKKYHEVGLGLVWNILDFGVSYAEAEQKADDVLIALERRSRVAQNIMVDINTSYWQAVAAQRMLQPVETLLGETKSALERSRQMEAQAAQNPEIALLYQKRLLQSIRDLSRLREEMLLAKTKLAALINLPVGTKYDVVVPADYELPAELKMTVEQLENIALSGQPELREEDYKTRIRKTEVKKSLIKMLPGIEISIGGDYNSNIFLYNNDWYSTGVRVSWNLLNVFTGGPAAKREAEAHVELADQRRMALSMAVLTQVWVSHQRYQLALEDYKMSESLHDVNYKIEQLVKKGQQADTRSQLDTVLVGMEELVSKTSREAAYARLQEARAQIYHAIGKDPLPEEMLRDVQFSFGKYDVPTLAAMLKTHATEKGI
jgi:outer membrane protein TolC